MLEYRDAGIKLMLECRDILECIWHGTGFLFKK